MKPFKNLKMNKFIEGRIFRMLILILSIIILSVISMQTIYYYLIYFKNEKNSNTYSFTICIRKSK